MTDKINWLTKCFSELSDDELYDSLTLRFNVFVIEQAYIHFNFDDFDRHHETCHILAYDDQKISAYLRILPQGLMYQDYISIGRVVVAEHARGSGLGHLLMIETLKICQQRWPAVGLKILAQARLERYYNQHGFVRISDVYLEGNIPHIEMVHQKK